MDKLTDRQLDVLLFIWDFKLQHGCFPTYNEIAKHYGFRNDAAYDYVQRLIRKGYLCRDKYIHRGLRLTGKLGFDGREYYTRVEVEL